MTQSPIKKHSQLMVNAHYGYISNSGGFIQTKVLFSIYGFDWVGWYFFWETESATIINAPAKDNTYTVFGTPGGGGAAFQPFKPLQVDEFANGNAPKYGPGSAPALLSVGSPTGKNLLPMGLTVFLEKPQNLELKLTAYSNPPKPPYHSPGHWLEFPAHHERGVVNLLKVEEWSSRALDERRFRRTLLGNRKLRVPMTLNDI